MVPFCLPMTIREPGTGYPVGNTRMTGLVTLDSEVIGSLLHLWLSLLHSWLFSLLHLWSNFITFIVGGFITLILWLKVIKIMVSITFMVNFYYIFGWHYMYGFYYIYG